MVKDRRSHLTLANGRFGRPSMEEEERNPDKGNQDSRRTFPDLCPQGTGTTGIFSSGAQGIGKSDSTLVHAGL